MLNKIKLSLTTMAILTLVNIFTLPQTNALADTTHPITCKGQQFQEISGFWSGLISNGVQSFSIGSVSDNEFKGVSVQARVQPIEGFNNAGVAFEIFDVTTGEVVSETKTTTASAVPVTATYDIPISKVKSSDELKLRFWGTSGLGVVTFNVSRLL